jgi:glycosyltransferase involved in cell wall biosynthesis
VIRFAKFFLLLKFCFEAIWCRFRYGVRCFYYVPAPGKRAAIYRDWAVMVLCRPFFPKIVYHWHANGLGDWLSKDASWIERKISHALLGEPNLGLSLAISSMRDALWFRSENVEVVKNGVPDPCPEYDTIVGLRKADRLAARRKVFAGEKLTPDERVRSGGDPETFQVFFLAHCTREKGVFDAIEGVLIANQILQARGIQLRMKLSVAGAFLYPEEEPELRELIARVNRTDECVQYVGFVNGAAKDDFLRTSDCMCFPTYYSAEGQPVSLLEAMAYGLQIVTTRWRALPELLPSDHLGFCYPRDPKDVARALLAVCVEDARPLRARFLENYTAEQFSREVRRALQHFEST